MKSQTRARRRATVRKPLLVEGLEARALLASFAEFGLNTGSLPADITTGPDGALWFTESNTDRIGRITTSGSVTEFSLASGSNPKGITTGPDGALWFTEAGTDKVGRITTSGSVTEFSLASGSNPLGITTGSDGNLWFTENGTDKVAEVVPSGINAGTITEYSLAPGSRPYGITTGPNGNLWFTEYGTNKVAEIVPSGLFAGVISEFSLSGGSGPESITTGSNGALWFTENGGNSIGEVTTSGGVTEFTIPTSNSDPRGIVSGPGGGLFFTEGTGNRVVQISTGGLFTAYAIPTSGSGPIGITTGPDNHLWFVESSASQIGRLNLNPTAVDDSYTTAANSSGLTVNAANGVIANDSDPEGDPLSVSVLLSQPSHGALGMNWDGSFSYIPNNNYVGTDSFTYQISDGPDTSGTATVTIQVDAPPVALNDAYTTPVNTALTVGKPANGVLANDIDTNLGHTLTSGVVSQPTNGTVVLKVDGTFTYVPNNGFHGVDSFTYRATDSDGVLVSNTATVTVTVDTPPVAVDDSDSTPEQTPLVRNAAGGVLANDTDPDGDPLSAVLVAGPAHGTLALNPDGSFIYTPEAFYFGPDSFVYADSDGLLSGNAAVVTLNVTPDHAPVAVDDSVVVGEGGLVSSAPGLLANDSDADGDPLTALLVSGPSHGQLAFRGDGSYAYFPDSSFTGTDSFTYRAFDGLFVSNPATVTLTFDGNYFSPVALDQAGTVVEGSVLTTNALTGVLAGATDFWKLPLTASAVTSPAHGSLSLNPDGSYTYTPTPGYHGADSFTFVASNGHTSSAAGTVNLTVTQAQVTVSGTIFLDLAASGTIAAGDPTLGGRTVFIDLHGDDLLHADDPQAVTDASGAFVIPGVPTGNQTLRLVTYPNDNPTGGGQGRIALALTAGQPATGQNIGLLPGSSVVRRTPSANPFAGATTPAEAVIASLYRTLLGRDGDPAGAAYWVGQVQAGMSYTQLTQSFLNSSEYVSNAIQADYRDFLHRDGSPEEINLWRNAFNAGMTETEIAEGFITSAEYQMLHNDDADFVRSLYNTVLGRDAAPSEVYGWTQLMSNGLSRTDVGADVVESTEAFLRGIEGDYTAFLGRVGDGPGVSLWLSLVQQGKMSLGDVEAAIVGSAEFLRRATV